MTDTPAIRAFDAVRALAFVGDLSMGQPTDHSMRTAWIADRIAADQGHGPAERGAVRQASLLRWSGCTANAAGFADLFGDDVAGREAMLAMRPEWTAPIEAMGGLGVTVTPLAEIHCEVSGEVARLLELDQPTEWALRHIFEAYDGTGMPGRLRGDQVPALVFIVALAGDIEIFTRVYGGELALAMIARKAGAQYPLSLAQAAATQAGSWLQALEQATPAELESALLTEQMDKAAPAELVADVIDLKLPWMTGFSRKVAETARACAARLGLDAAAQARVHRAGLLHGLGRTAIPNGVWNIAGPLPASAWEKVRLAPYWTSRVGKQIEALRDEAEIASFAYERLDGSGYFRGVPGHAIPVEGRILGAASAWVALRSDRPWRAALSRAEAAAHLAGEARAGRLDPGIVRLLVSASETARTPALRKDAPISLSTREAEVLRKISLGASNKEVARALELSPSTVRTHVESVFRKLSCSTRAAATLKASAMGLL